jgi:hypothetical protein
MLRSLLVLFFVITAPLGAQLKFLVEDFEGFDKGGRELGESGFFTFGGLQQDVNTERCNQKDYSGKRCLRISKKDRMDFGGWGCGVSRLVELDQRYDHLNFYVFSERGNKPVTFNIEIQEDDNNDGQYKKEHDDAWTCRQTIENKGVWELVSIPLTRFGDVTKGGDAGFNISYHHGKLCVILFSVEDAKNHRGAATWYFDFISFSRGPLPHGATIQDAPPHAAEDFAALGAWSEEGNSANFVDIARNFEGQFEPGKKLGLIHFFQSFSVEKGGGNFHYPSVERINKVVRAGYTPMITLEDHFVNAGANTVQPNLYSLVEGHFDSFFGYWAHQIKEVEGTVILRILHEFNGDWYPWCTVNNDKNPYLVAKAFRYIVNIFRQNNVTNVKFLWCPNSMSVPQQKWNYIMDAYPGDDYVDLVGLDIYNGAGTGGNVDIWRSFRKEGIENYFILTQQLPSKPLLICETASRERRGTEGGQNKGEWIGEMARTLRTDMGRVRVLAWFNEKQSFKVNSSKEAQRSFLEAVVRDPYFREGNQQFLGILK